MRFFSLILASIVILSGIGIQEAFSTPPCFLSPIVHWEAFNDIYTGKVVSVTNEITDVRVDFELEHVLKGNS